jgi:cobalamin biosynthesis protein CobD/CbiB
MAAVLIVVSMVTASCSVRSLLHEHSLPCRHEDASKTEDRERAKVALQRSVSRVKSNHVSSHLTHFQLLLLPEPGHVSLIVFVAMMT